MSKWRSALRKEQSPTQNQPEGTKTTRCAIYTRKSTDEGLAQEFNSLDAQREAGEAYIASQKHEGWLALPDKYDDGGFSGGSMERPALKRLLDDINAKEIDCVVVYKVDRLSRSLLDFARIMEVFDKSGVSFVSVTQQFNTTASLGRLTLNILLSFAQFEREIIAERTRDKMSAARRKGKWVGGCPVLGYDVDPQGGKLVVNEEEAKRVRNIFDLYRKHHSVITVVSELNGRGWTTKQWITREGKQHVGTPFNKAGIYRMLTNVTYVGNVNHKGTVYVGEHPAIVDSEVWKQVDGLIRKNGSSGGGGERNRYGALLRGLLFCEPCGKPMLHTYTAKGNRRYRYYVCLTAQQQGWKACPTKSVPAHEIEETILDQIRTIGKNPDLASESLRKAREQNGRQLDELKAELQRERLSLRKCNTELGRLAAMSEGDGSRVAQMADLHDRIQHSQERMQSLSKEITKLELESINEADFRKALEAFDPIWTNLKTVDRTDLLSSLLQRVSLNGKTDRLAISYRSGGLKDLCKPESF
jgi:site-specific DNA recombinase